MNPLIRVNNRWILGPSDMWYLVVLLVPNCQVPQKIFQIAVTALSQRLSKVAAEWVTYSTSLLAILWRLLVMKVKVEKSARILCWWKRTQPEKVPPGWQNSGNWWRDCNDYVPCPLSSTAKWRSKSQHTPILVYKGYRLRVWRTLKIFKFKNSFFKEKENSEVGLGHTPINLDMLGGDCSMWIAW